MNINSIILQPFQKFKFMYKTILIMTIAATMAQATNAQAGIGLTDEERAATEKHKKELGSRWRVCG